MKQNLTIPKEAAGRRLDTVLAELAGVSRSSLDKRFSDGLITINGEPARPRQEAQPEQVVTIEEPAAVVMPAAPDIPIVYEDGDILVINKPAGLAVHLSESGRPQATVAAFAAARGVQDDDRERPGIVHRLDKDTSGLMVVAKHQAAKTYMQRLFRERIVEKTYLAVVRGTLDQPEATIHLPIARDRKRPTRRAVVPGGRPALSRYVTSQHLSGASLIEVRLETGRTHQIRVHMAHLGHPVLGDALYGDGPSRVAPRQLLHAAHLSFTAPNGKQIDLDSPMPEDMLRAIADLQERV